MMSAEQVPVCVLARLPPIWGYCLSTPLVFHALERFRWEAYEVFSETESLGFVSRLPEGLWLAYRLTGALPPKFPSRDDAARALAGEIAQGSPLAADAAVHQARRKSHRASAGS